MIVCPVCDLQVDDDAALAQALTTEYQGVYYYFNAPEYKERFENDPQRYVGQTDERHWVEEVELGLDR
jgi:YHS domain-containing protein